MASSEIVAPPAYPGSLAKPPAPPAGILLGAARSGYEAASLELFPGDLILLYSDGLIERRHRSLDEGPAALTTAAAGMADPENMISAVLDALGSTDTEDDTCLVALYAR